MEKVKTIKDLNYWVKVRLAINETSLRQIAREMNIAYPSLSEAINSHPQSKKYIKPIVEKLGGDIDEFEAVI